MKYQIIGIDLANENSDDNSAISSKCSYCKSIIEIKIFDNKDNTPQATIFKKCPICGVRFEKHILQE